MSRLRFLMPFVLGAVCVAVQCQTIQINKDNRTVAITTSGSASALADTAVVSVGFVVYGADSDGTFAEGSRLSNAIVTNMMAAGVAKEAIASRSQNLQPIGDDDKLRYGRGLRFSLTQMWQVTVPADRAASLLQVAISAGANNSGDVQWSLEKRDALQAEAAEKALTNARQIAERMARGLGGKLTELLYASNQQPQQFERFRGVVNTEVGVAATVVRKAAPLAMVPDRVTEFATVYAVFGLE